MQSIYNFVTGPLAWVAWGVFILGSIYRLVYMYNKFKTKDASSEAYMSWYYSLRSILAWLIPYKALGWQKSPITTAVTFIFHICLILTPIFLLAHAVLWQQWFGVTFFWTLPDVWADAMTGLVILACVYFMVRRLTQKDVRYLTKAQDWWILLLVVSPFFTGFLAYHQIFNYQVMIVLHVLCGLAWLALIPFTRLAHALFILFTRAYLGSEFGGVRKVKDW